MAIHDELPRRCMKTSAVSARCQRPQRWAAAVVLLALLFIGSWLWGYIGSWSAAMAIVLWTLAALVHASCKARVWRARRRCAPDRQPRAPHQRRGVFRRLFAAVPSVLDQIIDHSGMSLWAAAGPVAALTWFGVVPALLGAVVAVLLVLAAAALFLMRDSIAEAKQYVSVGWLAYAGVAGLVIVTWICFSYGWPKPSSDVFKSLAQLNATLLVTAVLTIAAPTAWRTTPQKHFAWIAAGPLWAIIGLSASIAGAISNRSGEILLPIALAPVPTILMALVYEAYYRVDQEHKSPKDSESSL